jgi:hypothetical protein
MKSNSDNLEYLTENFELKKENDRLAKENSRLDCLLDYWSKHRSGVLAMCEQRNSALMHYNELQSRSAEVEAMAMNFEQRVADAVAKAGIKGTIGRGKPNHNEWISGGISVENPTSEMATPPSRKTKKIIYQRQWSCKSQAASAIRFVIAHS